MASPYLPDWVAESCEHDRLRTNNVPVDFELSVPTVDDEVMVVPRFEQLQVPLCDCVHFERGSEIDLLVAQDLGQSRDVDRNAD